MGLSRNKVAVPEGAAGTPPFWSDASTKATALQVAVALLILNQVSLLPFFLYRKFVKPIERSPGIGITVLYLSWLERHTDNVEVGSSSLPGTTS